jgi:ATP-dependent Lon protease
VKANLKIIPVSVVDEVLTHALARPLAPIDWSEEDQLAEERHALGAPGNDSEVRPH